MNTRKVRSRIVLLLLAVALAMGALVAVNAMTIPLFGQNANRCVTGGAVSAGNAGLAADCETLLGLKASLRGSAKLKLVDGPPN